MSRVSGKKNTYNERLFETDTRRTPPLSAHGMIAERNSRLLRSEPFEEEQPVPRKATKKKKVYRKKTTKQKGIDAPVKFSEMEVFPENIEAKETIPSTVRYPHISFGEKSLIVFIIILAGAILAGIISISAYSANIQNGINVKKTQTAAIQKDIDSINIAIEEAKTITKLEEKAVDLIGMKYPTAQDTVYLNMDDMEEQERIAQSKDSDEETLDE